MAISISEAQAKLSFWKVRADEYDAKARANGGKYTRSDSWYHEYCVSPYLAFSSADYLASRLIDQHHNNVRLTALGQIAPRTDFSDDDGLFGPLFAHIWMEYQARGGTPVDVILQSNEQLAKYFQNSPPTGVALFRGVAETLDDVVVKFGRRAHLERMLKKGEVRLTPSSFYSNGSLVKAMRDLETQREFHVPAFDALLRGETQVKIQDLTAKVEDGFVRVVVECPDYLLWCACEDVDRRLPDDFQADSALIIRRPEEFARRFASATKRIWPKAKFWFGPVTYYDPCSHVHMKSRPETIKHFSFAYQREWRICVFPSTEEVPREPLTLQLGTLEDIGELVTAPS